MTPEKWLSITGNIKDKFSISDEGEIHLDDEGGVDIQYIEFTGPLGQIRLEFIIKPVIIDKKTTYSKRIGSETAVEYIYSKEEKSHQLIAYKWDNEENEWQEISAKAFDN